jgi:lipoprotein-anchoring transpeptidase ErfK/SrfK
MGHRPGQRVASLVVLGLGVVTFAACTASTASIGTPSVRVLPAGGAGAAVPVPSLVPAPGLVLAPAPDATGVPVTDPVTVSAISAVVDTVALTDARGRPVPGKFDAAGRTWHSTAALDYGRRYTLAAAGTGANRIRLVRTASFTTVQPTRYTEATLRASKLLLLADRDTYGVGQPIVVTFDDGVTDRAAAERSLLVTTAPHVDGAWHWFGDREVHWRPQRYWQPGTVVTVKANLYGTDLGDGTYVRDNASATFRVGPSKIAIADDTTYRMKAFVSGTEIRDIPVAMGRHESIGDIDLHTRSGPHVVLGNDRYTRMTSASYGLTGAGSYDTTVEWTTHISYEGEYVHAAPWSVGQQGNADASHGCINVDTENAIWFYNTFGPGDIVDVRNTGVPLSPTDGLVDWTLSWPDWLSGSALEGGALEGGALAGGSALKGALPHAN